MLTEITNLKEVRELPEFDNHYAVFLLENKDLGFKGYISIHRKNPILPSFGATRMWRYENDTAALRDSLRLSRGMSHKAALAGLCCGGAKGVIIGDPTSPDKAKFLQEYARHVDLLKGQFITGTDVGLAQEDLAILRRETPYIVGFNDNSTEFTILGVYSAIEVCLQKIFGSTEVKDRSFAIQGLGKIGAGLTEMLESRGCHNIFVSDIDSEKIKEIKRKFPDVKVVEPGDIHRQQVDVFSPCALSGVINKISIGELRCKIIAGGANNQLAEESLGEELLQKNILYAPDYVTNSGGVIGVFDEYSNKAYNRQSVVEKVCKVKDVLGKIFSQNDKEKKATNIVANGLAEKIFNHF